MLPEILANKINPIASARDIATLENTVDISIWKP